MTKERQAYVLEQMTRHGFITEEQARDAYAEPLQIKTREVELKAPHWVMYIRDLVEQKYGAKTLYQGGLKIYTTLDLDYNEKMEQVLQDSKEPSPPRAPPTRRRWRSIRKTARSSPSTAASTTTTNGSTARSTC